MTTGVALNENYTTNAELASLMESIRNHQRTRIYGGEELVASHQKNCSVVDQSRATRFEDFDAVTPCSSLPWTLPEAWTQTDDIGNFIRQIHDPAFTPIAVLFEPFLAAVAGSTAIGDTYEVNVRSQFLGHYAQGTMLANLAIDPASSPDKLDKHRSREESTGSDLSKVWAGIKSGARWTWDHAEPIMRGIGGAIEAWGSRPKYGGKPLLLPP
jgi:hypothetical protein